MRLVVQRVLESSVKVDGREVGRIGKGFMVLCGVEDGDTAEDVRYCVDKTVNLRIFEDENGKTNLSLSQVGGSILSVSQFTLYGSVKEGNRPSFVSAVRPDEARVLYEEFYSYLKTLVPSLQGGVFQADMVVSLENDGPFTLVLDSKELFEK